MSRQLDLRGHDVTPMRSGPTITVRLLGLVQSWLKTLNQADLAMREGKAVDLITEVLDALPGVEEVRVDDEEQRIQNGHRPVIAVLVTDPGIVTREMQHMVKVMVAEVNKRYGTIVTVRFAKAHL